MRIIIALAIAAIVIAAIAGTYKHRDNNVAWYHSIPSPYSHTKHQLDHSLVYVLRA